MALLSFGPDFPFRAGLSLGRPPPGGDAGTHALSLAAEAWARAEKEERGRSGSTEALPSGGARGAGGE